MMTMCEVDSGAIFFTVLVISVTALMAWCVWLDRKDR